jgi:hypothetical protein
MRKAQDRPFARGREGIERRRLHFDRQDTGRLRCPDRIGGLAERRIRRPGGPDLDRHAGSGERGSSEPNQAPSAAIVCGGR